MKWRKTLFLADRTLQDTPWFVRHDFFKNSFFLSIVEWNGTRLTKVSENQKVLMSLKKAFQNLYGHLKTEFISAITLMKLNY